MTWTRPTNMMKQRLQTCFVNSSAPRLTRASVQVCEARTGWLVDIIFPTTLHHREVRERHQYRRNVHVQAQPRRRPPLPRCGSVLLSMAFFQRVTAYDLEDFDPKIILEMWLKGPKGENSRHGRHLKGKLKDML